MNPTEDLVIVSTDRAPADESARPDGGAPLGPDRRALIVDGDPRSASHFKETLDRIGVHAVAARSVAEARDLAATAAPHLLVLTMPVRETRLGLELANELLRRHGTACIVVLDRVEPAALQDATAAGAHSVLCKPVHREQLEATFRLAIAQDAGDRQSLGQREASSRLSDLERAVRAIAHVLEGVDISVAPPAGPLGGLRPREREVVGLLLQHLRVPAIARRLGISQQTVRNHLKGVFRHTGVRSQQELLDRFAVGSMAQEPAQAGHVDQNTPVD